MSKEESIEAVKFFDKATTKIQADFLGHHVSKRLIEECKVKEKFIEEKIEEKKLQIKNQKDMENKDEQLPLKTLQDKSAAKIQAGVRGYLVRKRQQVEQAAATRIQAGFRGFRTRKLLKQSGQ